MLTAETLVVGQLKTNCYLVFDETSRKAIIVDPGDDAFYVEERISDLDITPVSVIATHGHFDHILAAFELQTSFNIPFLMSVKDKFLLKRMRFSAEHFTKIFSDPPPLPNAFLKGGDTLKIGRYALGVIETPGHTPGSISLYSKESGFVISGDLVFAGKSVGRTDHKYSDKKKLAASVKKILKLPSETIVFPGHGIYTSVGALSRIDFLA